MLTYSVQNLFLFLYISPTFKEDVRDLWCVSNNENELSM